MSLVSAQLRAVGFVLPSSPAGVLGGRLRAVRSLGMCLTLPFVQPGSGKDTVLLSALWAASTWAFPLSLSLWSYLVAQSFVFAVEEINRSVHLLPNLTLGFSIRNSGCSAHGAVFEMMSFLTGQEEPIPNYTCGPRLPRVAVVGDTRSALSVPMARLLGLYKFPQVSLPRAFT